MDFTIEVNKMALKFGTKAGNLICLKKKIRTANIVEMVVFNIAEWQTKKIGF